MLQLSPPPPCFGRDGRTVAAMQVAANREVVYPTHPEEFLAGDAQQTVHSYSVSIRADQ